MCGQFNARLIDTEFKAAARSAFEAYQQALRPVFEHPTGATSAFGVAPSFIRTHLPFQLIALCSEARDQENFGAMREATPNISKLGLKLQIPNHTLAHRLLA
jgi:hypothetical protein